jgi:hypothetical protein
MLSNLPFEIRLMIWEEVVRLAIQSLRPGLREYGFVSFWCESACPAWRFSNDCMLRSSHKSGSFCNLQYNNLRHYLLVDKATKEDLRICLKAMFASQRWVEANTCCARAGEAVEQKLPWVRSSWKEPEESGYCTDVSVDDFDV